MALFDFLTGGAKKKPASGPHVTRDRQENERKQRLADIAAAKAKNAEASGKLEAADKAKADADEAASKKKKTKDFWGKVLGKNDG